MNTNLKNFEKAEKKIKLTGKNKKTYVSVSIPFFRGVEFRTT